MSKEDSVQGASTGAPGEMDAELVRRIELLRTQVRESFGQIVMAIMAMPRYRHASLSDLQQLVLEPLIRDRIAIAQPKTKSESRPSEIAGMAIWASVSEEVDAKLREQIRTGVWPIRLKSEDWTSGEINWLIDVIAPSQESVGSVLGSFPQVVEKGELRLHPIIARLVDQGTLDKLRPTQKTTGSNT